MGRKEHSLAHTIADGDWMPPADLQEQALRELARYVLELEMDAGELPATEARIAHFWSEWTDDGAPLQERGVYAQAARDFLRKFTVTAKEGTDADHV